MAKPTSSHRERPSLLPAAVKHEGRYVVLEPLAADHVDGLWASAKGADETWAHLRIGPFASRQAFAEAVTGLMSRSEQPFWAIRPADRPTAQGWLSYCDIYPDDRSIEIGQVWFSPILQQTRAATEAVYLLMDHALGALGYRRLVWRCSAANTASRRAAERLGFRPEGLWRDAAVIKGQVRDVAWHSILRDEWPKRRRAFETWLDPANFDDAGRAKSRLRRAD